jgi:hypothetical protein
MTELKPCPCIHACDIQANAIGETLAYCELTAEWMNISFVIALATVIVRR